MNAGNLLHYSHENIRHANMLIVGWQYGNKCNLKCSYCPLSLHNGSAKWLDMPTSEKIIDKIKSYYKDRLGKDIYFDLSGGEITLYPDLKELLNYIKTNGCYSGICTNGKRSINYWEEMVPFLDHITLSYHPASQYKDLFYKAAVYIHDKVSCHINIMMHPDYFSECEELGLKIAGSIRNASISFQALYVLLGVPVLMNYSNDQLRRLNRLNKETKIFWDKEPFTYRGRMVKTYIDHTTDAITQPDIIINNENRWKSWKCWAGLEQIVINRKKEVFRAWCEQDLIGKIGDDDLKFPCVPVICKKDSCSCAFDILCTKKNQNIKMPDPDFKLKKIGEGVYE